MALYIMINCVRPNNTNKTIKEKENVVRDFKEFHPDANQGTLRITKIMLPAYILP